MPISSIYKIIYSGFPNIFSQFCIFFILFFNIIETLLPFYSNSTESSLKIVPFNRQRYCKEEVYFVLISVMVPLLLRLALTFLNRAEYPVSQQVLKEKTQKIKVRICFRILRRFQRLRKSVCQQKKVIVRENA